MPGLSAALPPGSPQQVPSRILAVGGRSATFGEFGEAVVEELLTPALLRRLLLAAIDGALADGEPLADFGIDVVGVQVRMPTSVSADPGERAFAVTIDAQLEADVGPRLFGMGVDADVEIVLTLRVRAFAPAAVRFHIDPVRADDLRFRVRGRSDWLPFPLVEGGGSRLARTAHRSLPVFCRALNRMLDASAGQRQVDLLELVRGSGAASAGADGPRTGSLGPGESVDWVVDNGDRERVRVALWAGLEYPPAAGAPRAAPVSTLALTLTGPDGEPAAEVGLPVHRVLPELDTADSPDLLDPGRYGARLVNSGSRTLVYRAEELRRTMVGERIDFAELGDALIRRGLDRVTVAGAVRTLLAQVGDLVGQAWPGAVAEVTAQKVEVEPDEVPAGELRFRITLVADTRLAKDSGRRPAEVSATVRARLPVTVRTLVEPATLVVTPGPLTELRVLRAGRRVRGWLVPLPAAHRILTPVRARLTAEVERRLADADLRFVAAVLAAEHPLSFAEPPDSLRERVVWRGRAAEGRPGRHPVRLADDQPFRLSARIRMLRADFDEPPTDPPTAELTLRDEHDGVCWTGSLALPPDGEPAVLRAELAAPRAGRWELRVTATDAAEVDYELRVRPES